MENMLNELPKDIVARIFKFSGPPPHPLADVVKHYLFTPIRWDMLAVWRTCHLQHYNDPAYHQRVLESHVLRLAKRGSKTYRVERTRLIASRNFLTAFDEYYWMQGDYIGKRKLPKP